MNTYIIIGIGFGILLFLIFKRSIFRKEKSTSVKSFTDSNALMNNEKLKNIIDEFISRGKKIEAIKYTKESENVSLSEAKDFVEKIELLNRSGSKVFSDSPENVYKDPEEDPVLTEKIKAFILSGKKITAIKLVVDEKKTGLAEAKDYVERIESDMKKGF